MLGLGQIWPGHAPVRGVHLRPRRGCPHLRREARQLRSLLGANEDFYGNEIGQTTPQSGQFASINAGDDHTCGVRIDGSVACWGKQARGLITLPEG